MNPAACLCAICAISSLSGVAGETVVPTHSASLKFSISVLPSTPVSSAISIFAPDVPRDASSTGTTIIAIIKIGPRIVIATNHFVRTRSRNSRFAITNASRMITLRPALCDRRLVATDPFDEDLVERRHDALEPADRDIGREELCEQLLRPHALGELDLAIRDIARPRLALLRDQRLVFDHRLRALLRRIVGEAECDQALAAGRALDVAQVALEHLLAARDDADEVTDLLGLLHAVGREHHGPAVGADLLDDLAQDLCVDRIETTPRLVEDHERRLVDQRGRELDLLLHALRQVQGLVLHPLREPEPFEPLLRAPARLGARHPAKLAHERDHLEDLHLRIEAALLGQVADLRRGRGTGRELVEDRDLAAVRRDDVVDHPQRRRLAGAIRTEDAVDHPARDLEREAVDCGVVAELLDDRFDAKSCGHAAGAPSPSTARSSTAMRSATPQLTCWRSTARGPSATCGDTSTPRLIGPGCITIASPFAYASVRSDRPNVRDSSRVFGNRGASPSNRSCWTRSIITTSAPSSPSSRRGHSRTRLE